MKGCGLISPTSHNIYVEDYLPDTLLRFLVTLVGTNFKADIDFSNSSMSMWFGDFFSGIGVAGGFDWDAELRRRNLPSRADDVEIRRLWLFMGRSMDVWASIPSLTM